jgi:hypothetical protein
MTTGLQAAESAKLVEQKESKSQGQPQARTATLGAVFSGVDATNFPANAASLAIQAIACDSRKVVPNS